MHNSTNQHWMTKAIELAKSVKDEEVPVGALIIKDNKLVSKAVNMSEKLKDATAHAEIQAIKEASKVLGDWRLTGCTMYVTLEPCPMCTGAIINSRLEKLIYGASNVTYGACGTVANIPHDLKKNNQIEIIGGILEEESSKLLKSAFRN